MHRRGRSRFRRVYVVGEIKLLPFIDQDIAEDMDGTVLVTNDGYWTLKEVVVNDNTVKLRYCIDILAVFRDPHDSYLYIVCKNDDQYFLYEFIRDFTVGDT